MNKQLFIKANNTHKTINDAQDYLDSFYRSLIGYEFKTNINYHTWELDDNEYIVKILGYWESEEALKINYNGEVFHIERYIINNLVLNDLTVIE